MFYYFMLYHSSALEFIIERYISIVYYNYYSYSRNAALGVHNRNDPIVGV